MPAQSQYVDHLETLNTALEMGEEAAKDGVITPEEWQALWNHIVQSWREALRLLQTKRLSDHIDHTGTVNKNMLSDLRAFERQYESLEVRACARNMLPNVAAVGAQYESLEVRLVWQGVELGTLAFEGLNLFALTSGRPGQETTDDCSQQSPVDLVPKPESAVGLSA